MALRQIPVVLPYRLGQDPQGPVYSLHAETVASGEEAALAIARVLLETHVRIRRRARPSPMLERAVVGQAEDRIEGPYAYCFTGGDRIPHLVFPPRLEATAASELDAVLAGLTSPWVHGVVIDCAPLASISSEALAALARHAERLCLQLFRLPESVERSLRQAGLHKRLRIHPDLAGALGGLLHVGTTRIKRAPPRASA